MSGSDDDVPQDNAETTGTADERSTDFADALAEFAWSRRRDLHLTQEEVAGRSGGTVSTANYRVIEGGRSGRLRDSTRRGLQLALDWPPYAIDLLEFGVGEDVMWVVGEIGSVLASLRSEGVASSEDAEPVRESIEAMEAKLPLAEVGARPLTGSPELRALLTPPPPPTPPGGASAPAPGAAEADGDTLRVPRALIDDLLEEKRALRDRVAQLTELLDRSQYAVAAHDGDPSRVESGGEPRTTMPRVGSFDPDEDDDTSPDGLDGA